MTKHMLVATMFAFMSSIAACGGESSVGSGGTGGVASSGGSTAASGGAPTTTVTATSSTSSSTTTSEQLCGSEQLLPFDCSFTYPDALKAYDPEADLSVVFGPAEGRWPNGAAAGRVDQNTGPVVAVTVRLSTNFGGTVPEEVKIAVWQEPVCGLPSQPPPFQTSTDITITPGADYADVRAKLVSVVTLDPSKGFTWVAFGLTQADTFPLTTTTIAQSSEPRFAWFGLVDTECDGTNDDVLGWEDIRTPSATGVAAADADLVIGINTAP